MSNRETRSRTKIPAPGQKQQVRNEFMEYVEKHNIVELMHTIMWTSFVNKEANPKRFVLEYLQKELGCAQQNQGSSSAATSDAKHQEQADPKKKKRFKQEEKRAKAINFITIDHFLETTHQEQADPKKKRFKQEEKPAINDTIDRSLHFFKTTEVTKK